MWFLITVWAADYATPAGSSVFLFYYFSLAGLAEINNQ
jgi:hypothetical protein